MSIAHLQKGVEGSKCWWGALATSQSSLSASPCFELCCCSYQPDYVEECCFRRSHRHWRRLLFVLEDDCEFILCVSPECWNHLRPFPKQVHLRCSYHVLRALRWWSGMIHAVGSPLWAWPVSSLPTRMFSPCRPRCLTSTNISNNLTRNYARTPEIQQLLEPPPFHPSSSSSLCLQLPPFLLLFFPGPLLNL